MNIQVDSTSSNLASAMLNSKIRPRAVVGYGVQIFRPSPPNYVTRSPGEVYENLNDKKQGCSKEYLLFSSSGCYKLWVSETSTLKI